ncbi:Acetylaminoadipate kinase [Candidatus Nitrosotalea sp. TS]|nr:Acetylaminoadipate kinase [Candidatus Nitrosotalea sp. TS]
MITIKIGGSVVDGLHPSTISDLKKVSEQEKVILVHGGGKEVTRISEALGKEQKFIVSPGGIKSRYTDKENCRNFHNGNVRQDKQDDCKHAAKKWNQCSRSFRH